VQPFGFAQGKLELDQGRVGIPDRDEQVGELYEQPVYLVVMRNAPVGCLFSPDDVGLAEGEETGQTLAQIAMSDENVLTIEGGSYTCLHGIEVAERKV
jgi:hypothetical protein